ncbi:MAG: hypothetical protein HQM09_15375 [Candidatus Riflebacteria bacterium]|nr:hypothetical protein [Candidatus Riflebacteria bacterium]
MTNISKSAWVSDGQSLVEILIAITCFIAAALPIVSIFSFNMENTKIIYAKSITYSAASELLSQAVLIPVDLLKVKAGGVAISTPETATVFYLVDNNEKTKLFLTPLPSGYIREITIDQLDSGLDSFRVSVSVKTQDQPRANIEMAQTVSRNLGGR